MQSKSKWEKKEETHLAATTQKAQLTELGAAIQKTALNTAVGSAAKLILGFKFVLAIILKYFILRIGQK